MKFTKMQGTGNDYIYIDARSINLAKADLPSLSRTISNRHFGVGSDGIILILPSESADLRMLMFNSDGSQGQMCGNGLRCFGKYVIDRGIVQLNQAGIHVETPAGIRTVVPLMEGKNVTGARVAMGSPELDPNKIPVVVDPAHANRVRGAVAQYPLDVDGSSLKLTFISMGNPHAVAFLDAPVEKFPLHRIGPLVEHHPMFPNGVNFEVVNVENKGRLRARVWERGSGETLACGTGACGVAVAAQLLGLSNNIVDIMLPGGVLNITWDGVGEVYMEGDAIEVFEGEWEWEI